MKQKYILEVYDKLIDEIKQIKTTNDFDIISYLQHTSKESYFLHQVKFYRQKGQIKYAFQKGIHNLHPYAPAFINSNCDINPNFENLVPFILKELNIPDNNLQFCWTNQEEKTVLIIKEQCSLENLAPEILFFLYCYHRVKNQNDKIKRTHKEKYFDLKHKSDFEPYIHRKQKALENMSIELLKDITPTEPKEIYEFSSHYNKIDCLKIIYIYIEKLLIFIEKEYHNYLDLTIKVPYRTKLVKEKEIDDKLQFVKSRLSSSHINKELFKLAYQPLLKIATIYDQTNITYSQFYYCIEYITKLYDQLNISDKEVSESDLNRWLFDLNFNSLEYFDYKTDEIIKSLHVLESVNDKIDELYQLLKCYNQRQRYNYNKFDKKLPSIKEQIVNWIEEEIDYLSKKKSVVISSKQEDTFTQSRVKIQTSLSVAQLAYFFKLLMMVKIIINKNHSEIFRFIAENFSAKEAATISAKSVKSKFYNVEWSTITSIRDFIIDLLNFTK